MIEIAKQHTILAILSQEKADWRKKKREWEIKKREEER